MMLRTFVALNLLAWAVAPAVAQEELIVDVSLDASTESGGVAVSAGIFSDFGALPIERGEGVYEGKAFGHDYSVTLADGEATMRSHFRGEAMEFGPVAKVRGAWSFTEVPVADTECVFIFLLFEEGPDMRVRVGSAAYLNAVVTVGAEERLLLIADTDLDQTYGSAGDCWDLVSEARMVRSRGRFGKTSLTEMNEPVFLSDGRALRLESATKSRAKLVFDADAGTQEASLKRRHARVMAAFDARGGAAAEMADAGDRPRGETDPNWRHALSLDDVLAEAAQSGKPLLIDFEADW